VKVFCHNLIYWYDSRLFLKNYYCLSRLYRTQSKRANVTIVLGKKKTNIIKVNITISSSINSPFLWLSYHIRSGTILTLPYSRLKKYPNLIVCLSNYCFSHCIIFKVNLSRNHCIYINFIESLIPSKIFYQVNELKNINMVSIFAEFFFGNNRASICF
jgi:hypothetical protein